MRRKKLLTRLGVGLAVLAVLASLLVGTALIGNDYRFTQTVVSIPSSDGDTLSAVLTLPERGEARGLVVMVHGDGPVDAEHDGLYAPWFEGAADAGFATLSWSKPGVGDSGGDWLRQSMDDRAAEVGAALDWAEQQHEIPTDTVVLWGASQAGWVLGKVASVRDDVDALVAVGPAINWLEQGRFNLLAELDHDGADAQQRADAIADSDRTLQLLRERASYEQYLASGARDPMTEARWGFVLANFDADAGTELADTARRGIPVHLMLGEHDRNVDTADTERAYRAAFGEQLSVQRVDGAHSLAKSIMEDNDVVGLATGIVWPRALLADGAIDGYKEFLERVSRRGL